ncbi:hypothetical protein [Couchioplanes azureus]|uniref:hypothetical protein n=1 Tax=Couchioplanes caeruleus TaxID=56438 RepID=UPI0016705414|nr:hypothetical protein [Couchioplanes caeruleus]GGQ65238.1 hypothetical protein GCM10010166_38580 [Couchioplanes caeruleus subsp. azureus]
MTYDYGAGATPRGQGQPRGQQNPAGPDTPGYGDGRPQRPPHDPRPHQAGTQYGGHPQDPRGQQPGAQYGSRPQDPRGQQTGTPYGGHPQNPRGQQPGTQYGSRPQDPRGQQTGTPYGGHPQDPRAHQPGGHPFGGGQAGPQPPRGHDAQPPAGFQPPRQRSPMPGGDTAPRPRPNPEPGTAGVYGSGGTPGIPAQYASDPSRSGTATGSARGSQSTLQQPALPDLGDAEPAPETGRRSRKPLVVALVLLLLGAGGGAGWYYLRGSADKAPTAQELKVADRQADPEPLTADEVFGADTVAGTQGEYKVLKTQAASDCGTAAGGAVAKELASAGCNQVVRATLTSPDGKLVITAGIFNLENRTRAQEAAAAIDTAVKKGQGRFGGLVAGKASNIISRAAANLAWDVHGHYLVYCLVANADGSAIAADDPRAQTVRKDLAEKHLGDAVIDKRANGGAPKKAAS